MILKGAHIISPADNIDDILDIKIENGVIVKIAKDILAGGIQGEGLANEIIDFSGKIITPGLIDMHCHLREPGFEYKETIQTGVESALNGGYTAICPMANTNPTVDNVETLKLTIEKAQSQPNKIGFHPVCAITKGLKSTEMTDFNTLRQAGAIAFSDDGKPLENMVIFKEALSKGELIMSHAEDSKLLTDPLSEAISVARELEVVRSTNGKLHFAHISTKRAIELIRQAKKDGLDVTCETAPHYFTFTKEDETENGRFKMNPPLRTKEDLEAVIEGLKDGTIDCIATDHAPHSLEEKTKPFTQAPFGIVGFETAFGLTYTKLVETKHLTLSQAIEKLSVNPAKILKIDNQGQIKLGNKANLAIFNLHDTYKVCADEFKTKCKISPFEAMELKGKAIAVVTDGKMIKLGEN